MAYSYIAFVDALRDSSQSYIEFFFFGVGGGGWMKGVSHKFSSVFCLIISALQLLQVSEHQS